MHLLSWSEDKEVYNLPNGFTIVKADPQEFAIHLAAYDSDNVEGVLGWEEKVLFSTPGSNAFWIKQDGLRIGGVEMGPNGMSSFFIEPPFNDSFTVLSTLKPLLIKWSDPTQRISLWGLPAYYDDFTRMGFWKNMTRCCMIRPTEKLDITLNDAYNALRPKLGDELKMSELSYRARIHSLETRYNQLIFGNEIKMDSEVSQYKTNIENIEANEILNNASTCLFNDKNELVGFCLINMHAKHPLVADMVVNPEHQGKGLATYMLKNALSELKSSYPVLRLFVTIGLNAEKLYHELGFKAGKHFTSFYMPEREGGYKQ